VREEHRRDVEVILNQVPLRYAELRPEELVEIRQLHDAVAELHIERVFILGELDGRDANVAALRGSGCPFDDGWMILPRRDVGLGH
jgi:hypothetical protein